MKFNYKFLTKKEPTDTSYTQELFEFSRLEELQPYESGQRVDIIEEDNTITHYRIRKVKRRTAFDGLKINDHICITYFLECDLSSNSYAENK